MSIKYDGISDVGGINYQFDPVAQGVLGSIQFNDGQGSFSGHPMANLVVSYDPNTGREYANIYATNLTGALSSGSLQSVVEVGNITTHTAEFMNVTTAIKTNMISDVIIDPAQLNNVSINYTLTDDYQTLTWNGTSWINHYPEKITTSTIADVTITRGQVVYVSTGNGASPRISPSDASVPGTMPCIGVALENGIHGDEVHVCTKGIVNLNLTGMTQGNTVYVSNATAGALIDHRPSGNTDLVQNIGIVIKSGNGGKLLVTGVGRTNDIPNSVIKPSGAAITGLYAQTAQDRMVRVPVTASGSGASGNIMHYDPTTFEILYDTVKTFVIPHPNRPGHMLVHGCLEGPEGGVYYRGRGRSGLSVVLPDYVPDLVVGEPTIHITPIGNNRPVGVSEWNKLTNSFDVIADSPTDFHWTFTAMRTTIDVEPAESDVVVKGVGPYRYI